MNEAFFLEKLKGALDEMKEIAHADFYLFSREGTMIAGTGHFENPEVENAALEFADSIAESQVAYGYFFIKIIVQNQLEYVLLSDMMSSGEYAFVIAQMAASQIRNLHAVAYAPMDEQESMRQLLLGELDEEQMRRDGRRRKIDDIPRMLYVLEFAEEKNEIAMETVRNLFVQDSQDFLVDMDEKRAVLLKQVNGLEEEYCRNFADILIDNIQAEAMLAVKVGYSSVARQNGQLANRYREACMALKICKIFYPKESVAIYGHLGIGQLIYQLPMDLCQRFLKEVFSEGQQELLDEEMLITVDKMFENNLNISETARQLYVHRNTLVYRLERMQKILGLDIRLFEDAMMFRIAMMVQSHVKYMMKEHPRKEN